ncbi:MAG: Lrp/AsnC ligand binding domain-containing protein [Nitrosopumilus sp.]|nr:Lrp/AsnC ligand binding domain-containing protein [Nitrosopumilus sp.]
MTRSSSVAFVLIKCKQESVRYVVNQIEEMKSVKEIALVDGQWKIIVKIESGDLDGIREAIRWKLRNIPEIESTLTLVEHTK